MTCKEANELPISELLEAWGFMKIRSHRRGDEVFFQNPLRDDTNPSFSVNLKRNLWIDFIDNKGGGTLDLVIAMQKTDVKGALQWLRENTNPGFHSVIGQRKKYVPPPPRHEFLNSRPIFSYGLKDYLKERKISLDYAKRYLREVRFKDTEKGSVFFALGLRNDSGGYSLRNKFGKIILPPNDVTYIEGPLDSKKVILFEGMFDFLSYLMIRDTSEIDSHVIVLNTLSYLNRAIGLINERAPGTKSIVSFLDNPRDDIGSREAMDRAIGQLKSSGMECLQANDTYAAFGDLSEYWTSTGLKGKLNIRPIQ